MNNVSFLEVLKTSRANVKGRKFPGSEDSRSRFGCIFPEFSPKFKIEFASKPRIFTIGSCFARNIEEVLSKFDVNLPTLSIKAPEGEIEGRTNFILNEYNCGTTSQRIIRTYRHQEDSPDTIIENSGFYADLLLPSPTDLPLERCLQRRREIANVYNELPGSDVVIITLGLVEAWFDIETGHYLNRMPPVSAGRNSDRFHFVRLGVEEGYRLLQPALDMITEAGSKVILSISPVPMGVTLSEKDCLIANEYSKSVLRVIAERCSEGSANIDYFPSFEIVKSGGLNSFLEDQIHVKAEVVRNITAFMVEKYAA